MFAHRCFRNDSTFVAPALHPPLISLSTLSTRIGSCRLWRSSSQPYLPPPSSTLTRQPSWFSSTSDHEPSDDDVTRPWNASSTDTPSCLKSGSLMRMRTCKCGRGAGLGVRAAGCRLQVAGERVQEAGERVQAAGCRVVDADAHLCARRAGRRRICRAEREARADEHMQTSTLARVQACRHVQTSTPAHVRASMHMQASMPARMPVRMHARTHACPMHARPYACMPVHMHARTHTCLYACMPTRMPIHMPVRVHAHAQARRHAQECRAGMHAHTSAASFASGSLASRSPMPPSPASRRRTISMTTCAAGHARWLRKWRTQCSHV
mmetsp:Transcript_14880/g.43709  ORF Transcript_14880/g.43709 Transcript_14880/m.43709 type:complete len:324 (-) Transcript_14880:3151-4122(-)